MFLKQVVCLLVAETRRNRVRLERLPELGVLWSPKREPLRVVRPTAEVVHKLLDGGHLWFVAVS